MNRSIFIFSLLIQIALFNYVQLSAQVPQLINYQARLTDPATGMPVADGQYEITFAIYDVPVDGTPLWSETQDVQITGGVYSVLLGLLNPIDASLFSDGQRYLGIAIGTDTEMAQRKRMVSVPYSFASANAEKLNGKPSDDFASSSHTHNDYSIDYNFINNTPQNISSFNNDAGYLTTVLIPGQVAGDMMFFDGTEWIRLPKGTDGQVLMLKDGIPLWQNIAYSTTPVVTTSEVTDILPTTASCGGTVTSDGGSTILARGVCWSTSPYPSVDSNKTVDGPGAGPYISNLKNLAENTMYHVRAYATNNLGTSYGDEKTFITPTLPVLTTNEVTDIRQTTATCGGHITFDGNAPITSRGVCWSLNQNPTITDSITVDGEGVGVYSSSISGLSEYTTYYARAYATNLAGTAYGNETSFKTHSVPAVYTDSATNITTTSATFNATASSHGVFTAVYFEYGTTTSYGQTIQAYATLFGDVSNAHLFVDIADLAPGTIYHYRAYATNIYGTTYGIDTTFATLVPPPIAVTKKASALTQSSVTLNGSVNANGFPTIVVFEYGLTTDYGQTVTAIQSPVTGNTETDINTGITGLVTGTPYHFRVRAENDGNIVYGSDQIFFTLTETQVADIDDNVYNTVVIGTQSWMIENLKTTLFNDNTTIPLITDNQLWRSNNGPAYCWYNNDEATYKSPFGAIYNWYAVSTAKLCPVGWHVPTLEDWTVLSNYLGGEYVAGGKIKESGTLHWYPNVAATNETGYTALPGGYRPYGFEGIGTLGPLWSSTELPVGYAHNIGLSAYNPLIGFGYNQVTYGMPVRCLRNAEP